MSESNETGKNENALRIRVVVGHMSTEPKPALRHVPIVLRLALPLLLPVAQGQFDPIGVLLCTTKFSKLKEIGDPAVLGRALGGRNQRKG